MSEVNVRELLYLLERNRISKLSELLSTSYVQGHILLK